MQVVLLLCSQYNCDEMHVGKYVLKFGNWYENLSLDLKLCHEMHSI
jgi:hypothetical protein